MISYSCVRTLPRKPAKVVDVVIHIASLVDISQRAGWTGTAGPAHYFQHPIQDQQSLFHQSSPYRYFQNFFDPAIIILKTLKGRGELGQQDQPITA